MSEPIRTGSASDNVHKILVPREIVNEDTVSFVAWSVGDGVFVEEGTELCIVETSKAAVTVVAEQRGYLRHRSSVGDDVGVGEVLGYLSEVADSTLPTVDVGVTERPTTISAKAHRKMEELGLDPALFAGRGLVRERDVVNFVANAPEESTAETSSHRKPRKQSLSAIQRRVARLLEQSTAIPVAYVCREVDFASVRERALSLSRESNMLITPVDLLVAGVAQALLKHPLFNARFVPPMAVELFEEVNVGVAMDVEDDLYVIVVKSTDGKSVPEIAAELRRMQMLALRRRLGQKDVTGGTVTVTAMIGRGVHRFQPILHPGETAIVAVAAQKSDSTRAELTVGFDHRVANGSQAAAFMLSVSDELVGATA